MNSIATKDYLLLLDRLKSSNAILSPYQMPILANRFFGIPKFIGAISLTVNFVALS